MLKCTSAECGELENTVTIDNTKFTEQPTSPANIDSASAQNDVVASSLDRKRARNEIKSTARRRWKLARVSRSFKPIEVSFVKLSFGIAKKKIRIVINDKSYWHVF